MLSQDLMKKTPPRASLRTSRSAHTVLLRMAADEARAQRIRDLREEHGLKWKELSNYVGVSERSAHQWGATGAISQDNAMKLAQLFREHGADIEADYIWRGERPPTPNLMAVLDNGDNQLDRIERKLDALVRLFAGLEDTEDQEAAIAALRNLAAVAAASAPAGEKPAERPAERQPRRRAG
jgi:DNA-binding transcriptional regulator YiaG